MSSHNDNDLFALMGNVDQIEGRGPGYVTCYVRGYELAVKIITSKEWGSEFGVMGYPGGAEDVRPATPVFTTQEQFINFANEKRAKRRGT